MGGADLILFELVQRFRWSEGLNMKCDEPIKHSKKRPQQDSNLRTRLRRPLPYIALTSANMVADGPAGRVWGAARQSFGRWRVAAGDSSRPHPISGCQGGRSCGSLPKKQVLGGLLLRGLLLRGLLLLVALP
jgi:hypothetical protein